MLGRLMSGGGEALRVRRLGGSRAGEIRLTRFLRNAAVTPEEMVAAARADLALRSAQRRILAIQDTSVVRSQGGGGLYLHATIAVDAADGALLGLIDGRFLTRTSGLKGARKTRPFADKQSARWLDGAQRAVQACPQAAAITVIADRESDIYELFARRPADADLVIRAAQNRALGDEGRLFQAADAWPRRDGRALDLPAAPGRAARTAALSLRFAPVSIARPKTADPRLPATVAVTLVDVREEAAPPGAAAIHWRLLTTRRIDTPAQAWAVAQDYRRRWSIEEVFRTLKKKGFDIEDCRIEAERPLRNLVMASLIAAVAIQQMVHARDGQAGPGAGAGSGPPRPALDAFDPDDLPLLKAFSRSLEGKTERQKNPHPETSLAYAAWVCARLGGWTGYYGKPGPIVLLRGYIAFHQAKRGARMITATDV